MQDQQNEIILYTTELRRRKQALEEQLAVTNAMIRESNKKGIDS